MSTINEQDLIAKIKSLPPEKIAVVDDFVEFLHHRDEICSFGYFFIMSSSEPSSAVSWRIWPLAPPP
jgi:hypothetical protein